MRAAVIVAFLGVSLQPLQSARAIPPGRRPPAPQWRLSDIDGKSVHLSDFKGKVVVLNFWATWCPPCRQEVPDFIDLQKKYASRGFTVVGVSVDEQGAAAKPFAKEMGMNYPVVLADDQIVAAYGSPEAIPTTFIIDRQGRVAVGFQGYQDRATFESQIIPLLSEPTTSP